MLLGNLREEVLEANLQLIRQGLALSRFGNARGVRREEAGIVMKQSGVPYEGMKPADLEGTNMQGKVIEGNLRPSSDLPSLRLCTGLFLRSAASIGINPNAGATGTTFHERHILRKHGRKTYYGKPRIKE
jgi:L-ribulose-5-phosphate 4-epimerase